MAKPILYGFDISPPFRAVLLTAKAIDLELEYRNVDMANGEHKTPEYLKKNPQHTIPLLEDDGKLIWDSHAISTYLISKYAKNDKLYPKDLYQRALVDQRLHFDSGILFMRLKDISEYTFHKKDPNIPPERITALYDAYDFLEKFLEKDLYMVGNSLTVADFSCIATISSLQAIGPVKPDRYPKLYAWMNRMTQLPYYEEANGKGAKSLMNIYLKMVEDLKNKPKN